MAKRKDTFKTKDNSFEAGYNQEPVMEEEKQITPVASEQPASAPVVETPVAATPVEEAPVVAPPVAETPVATASAPKAPAKKTPAKTTRAKKAPVAEEETSEEPEFDPLALTKKSTVYLSALQKEMLRIYCFKRNISYTEWHAEIVEEFFKNHEDIRKEAIHNVLTGIAK